MYDAKIKTYSDVSAFPGNYIYVEPAGFSPSYRSQDVPLTEFGVGGYYMIIRSEHTFGAGVADTEITAKWVAEVESSERVAAAEDLNKQGSTEDSPGKCAVNREAGGLSAGYPEGSALTGPAAGPGTGQPGGGSTGDSTPSPEQVIPPGCFVAGTAITMYDGTTKKIENIKMGDMVKTWNKASDLVENHRVIGLKQPIKENMIRVTIGDVTNTNTFDHPYYVKGKGWSSYRPDWTRERYQMEDVKLLEEGDVCYGWLDNSLEEMNINNIEEEIGAIQTYIFTVESVENFFANSILVHNKKVIF